MVVCNEKLMNSKKKKKKKSGVSSVLVNRKVEVADLVDCYRSAR